MRKIKPPPSRAFVVPFPAPAVPIKTTVFTPDKPGGPAAVMREWTPEDASRCKLCLAGCNARIERDGHAFCLAFAPPGPLPTPEQAAGLRLSHPMEHDRDARPIRWAKGGPPC